MFSTLAFSQRTWEISQDLLQRSTSLQEVFSSKEKYRSLIEMRDMLFRAIDEVTDEICSTESTME